MANGCFISLEGGEGCGKSTMLRLLADELRARTGREVVASRSPGGTRVAEKIRSVLKTPEPDENLIPETELLLFGACHAQMCERLIRPALLRGALVLSDRFTDSTVVYQGIARGLPVRLVAQLNAFACRDLRPHMTILLDLDPKIGLSRVSSRGGAAEPDRFDSEELAFHVKVRDGFLNLAKSEPDRFSVIDASADQETVFRRILEEIHVRLALV